MGILTVDLKYRNNLCRLDLPSVNFSYSDISVLSDLYDKLFYYIREMSSGEYPIYPKNYACFSFQGNNDLDVKVSIFSLEVSQVNVVYHEVVSGNAAVKSKLCDAAWKEAGARLEFYTTEKCHPFTPHVNVFFSAKRDTDKMCRINIRNRRLMDKRPAGVKHRQIAVVQKFIEEHESELLEEWEAKVQTIP